MNPGLHEAFSHIQAMQRFGWLRLNNHQLEEAPLPPLNVMNEWLATAEWMYLVILLFIMLGHSNCSIVPHLKSYL